MITEEEANTFFNVGGSEIKLIVGLVDEDVLPKRVTDFFFKIFKVVVGEETITEMERLRSARMSAGDRESTWSSARIPNPNFSVYNSPSVSVAFFGVGKDETILETIVAAAVTKFCGNFKTKSKENSESGSRLSKEEARIIEQKSK